MSYRCYLTHSYFRSVFLLFFYLNIQLYSWSDISIEGIILDASTSEPVIAAVIQVPNTSIYTTTKADGTFSIIIPLSIKFKLKITHLAYNEKLIEIDPNNDSLKKLIIYLIPKTITLSPVVVSDRLSSSIIDQVKDYSNVLKGRELQRQLSQTLASTLKNEAGLSVRSMGPAPSRPVYRGLGQDRILINEDGIKSVDLSATSPDHAVTIEPFSSDRIEVLRGPKILLHTSSSIGGVININKDEIPSIIHNTFHFTIGGYAETVNQGYLGLFQSEIPIEPFAVKFEFSRRKTDDLTTPEGLLKNSFSENINSALGLSYVNNFGYFGSSFRIYDLLYGIPGGFVGAHPNGVKIDIKKRRLRIENNFILNNFFSLKTSYSNIYYRHKEFEFSGRIGSEFKVITNMLKLDLNHTGLIFGEEGTLGISIEHRNFDIGGYVFTPPSSSLNLSTYYFEEFSLQNFNFNFAVRFLHDRINPQFEKPDSKIGAITKKVFNNYSAALSAIYKLSDIVYVGANVSKSSRVPTIEELFSEGPHLAAYSYEVGNPYLESEKGLGTEIFVYHKFEKLDFNINLFYNSISSYIIPRNTGEINYQTFLPIYKTFGVGAKLYGLDGVINWNFFDNFFFNTSFGYTIGVLDENKKPLPQIPPLKGTSGISKKTDNLIIGFLIDWAAPQKRVDEFEEPTAGYVTFNSFAQYLLNIQHTTHSFSVNIENIFNKSYRNHLSRIKIILPEAGFNIRLIYKLII